MRVSYSRDYFAPLPDGHVFPMSKFPALCHILQMEGLLTPDEIYPPEPASWQDLRLIHTQRYLTDLRDGLLDKKAIRKMGLPWSDTLVHRSRVAVQGTLNASLLALVDGLAANLAGGTHHAFPDHGEGFCVLNDVAVACKVLLNEELVSRILILDLDVHQGNGTAFIFQDDPRVFTFSMHGERNYPFRKQQSTQDVSLLDKLDDDAYLQILYDTLPATLQASQPELVFYLAGVDVHANDRFGRLKMTREGMHQRDRYVLESIKRLGVPLVLLLSGGYARTPEATADLHAITHRQARRVFGRVQAQPIPDYINALRCVRPLTELDYNILA